MKGQKINIEYEIISINVGKPLTMVYQEKEWITGIHKQAVHQPLFLSYLNFDGDGQADTVHHGGRDKAVCVYSYDHYPYWEKQLNKTLQVGAFGENLTVAGLSEEDVCIGDIYQLGEAIVQVSQPRYPCHKLAKKHNVPDLPLQVIRTGYSGFYLRVLQEGFVSREDSMQLIERYPQRLTISMANQMLSDDQYDKEEIRKAIDLDVLAERWRNALSHSLEKR